MAALFAIAAGCGGETSDDPSVASFDGAVPDAVATPDASAAIDANGNESAVDGGDRVVQFDGENFFAISGTSDDNVWVVGSLAIAPGAPSPCAVASAEVIVRRYDGAKWTRMDNVSKTLIVDIWVDAPEKAWVVGLGGAVAHYDGQAWTDFDVSGVTGVDSSEFCSELSLHSVWASAPTDVWVVGYVHPSAMGPALVLHYDGTTWTRADVQDLDGLFTVWGTSASDVWVAGSSGITHRFDGVSWSKFDAGTELYRIGLWGTSTDDVWAVGNKGSITHFDGSSWKLVRERDYEMLEAVWGASADDIWAVGGRSKYGTPPMAVALRWNGHEWLEQTFPTEATFSDVWVSPSGRAWAISGSKIARLDSLP